MKRRKLNAIQQSEICRLYEMGRNGYELSHLFGVSAGTIYQTLKENGIDRRSNSESHRTYVCDHSFFDNIDSELKAYWLGFVAADGNIFGNRLMVALASKDEEHLHRFRWAVGSTHPIRRTRGSGYVDSPGAAFAITSECLVSGLLKNGIGPKKSFTICWPEFLSQHLLRHYLRGYVDGDGCWSVRPDHYTRKDGTRGVALRWQIMGPPSFCLQAQSYLISTTGVGQTKLAAHRTCSEIAYLIYCGRVQVARIHRFLYEGATVWLPRKRDVAAPYIDYPANQQGTGRPVFRTSLDV